MPNATIQPAAFDIFASAPAVTIARPNRTSSGDCASCGRLDGCTTKKFPVYGEGRKGILLILEAPGPSDDENGTPLSGAPGLMLRKELRKHGIDPFLDCWTTFAVRCYSKAKPTGAQVATCRGFTAQDIERLKPKIIIPMGINAVTAVLDDRLRGRMTGTKPTAFIGCRIPDQEYRCWVCPTESPTYVSEMEGKQDIFDLWSKDVKGALSVGEWKEAPRDDIRLCYTVQEAVEAVRYVHRTAKASRGEIGFDYETTGIKPHRKGHKIICASMAYDGTAWAFPMFQDAGFREAWKALLTDPEVGKCAHNAQFEAQWTEWCLGYWPEGWTGDTCLDAHTIHNTKPTGLKFEVYTRLGIIGYDDAADAYIKSTEEGCNAFNRVEMCPQSDLLTYCARDSIYMMRVRELQRQDIREYKPQVKASRFFLDVSMELARCSRVGMRLDVGRMEPASRELEKKIAEAWAEAKACPEVVAMGQSFSLSSNQDLARLVYDVIGFKGNNGRSVDKNTLAEVDAPFVEPLLRARKYEKVLGTYFDQYRREVVDGVIRGSFSLNRVSSYRGSAGDPNLQNITKREKEIAEIVRSCFRPSPGNVLIEIDFGQLEAVIGAVFHQDPVMIKYLIDPSVNLHSDNAADIFMRDRATYDTPDADAKLERNAAKQYWFAESYGSNFEQTHITAWKNVGQGTKTHLASKGIKSMADFRLHCKKVDAKIWEERFGVYGAWKRSTFQEYKRIGYIELKTGFRCRGPLKYTEAINLHVQGSSAGLLFWTLLKTAPIVRGISGRSHIVANIHDALVIDAHPDEVDTIIRTVIDYGTNRVREAWPWITMPLRMEAEVSEIDGSWAKMKPYHLTEN